MPPTPAPPTPAPRPPAPRRERRRLTAPAGPPRLSDRPARVRETRDTVRTVPRQRPARRPAIVTLPLAPCRFFAPVRLAHERLRTSLVGARRRRRRGHGPEHGAAPRAGRARRPGRAGR